MTHKLKLVLACMVLITAVSAYQLFDSFVDSGNQPASVLSAEDISGAPVIDSDHDGLSDTDESVWNTDFLNPDSDADGFLDGEEIASGHDPAVPGPNDALIGQNLTDKTADLMTAGLLAKDLKAVSTNKNYDKSIDDVALGAIYDFYNSQPQIETSQVKSIPADQARQSEYLNAIAEIIQKYIIDPSEDVSQLSGDVTAQKGFFIQKSTQFRSAYFAVSSMEVPTNFTLMHRGVMGVLNQLYGDYTGLSQLDTDPLRAMIALNDINTVETTVKEILRDLQKEIAKNNLNLTGTFYEILSLIYQ